MRRMIHTKNMQAIVSLKGDRLDSAGDISRLFRGVELDFSDHIDEKKARDALCVCEKADLEVRAVHLPNLRRLSRMIGTRKLPKPLLDLTDTTFVFHAWMKNNGREMHDLSDMAMKIRDRSCRLVIENVKSPKKIFEVPKEVSDFFTNEGLLGFCLDTSHPTPRYDNSITETVLAFLKAAGSHLAHIHLSDADPVKGTKHLPLGKGAIGWQAFFESLALQDYRGLLTLEFDNARMEDYRQSIELLSGYGVSLDASPIVSLLNVSFGKEAAGTISRFIERDISEELRDVLGITAAYFIYSDERNCIAFFDKNGAGYAPLLYQLDFPRELPDGAGFLAFIRSAYRLEAMYMNRKEKVAVKRTLKDLYNATAGNELSDFFADIASARDLSFGSSSFTKIINGKII